MTSALSGVLQGIDAGLGRGMELYKTIEGEKRAKRMEERQLQRDAADDERWTMQWDRQLGLDKAAAEQRGLDNAHRTDVFEFTQQQHADNQEWKRREYEATRAAAAEASRLGWARVNNAQQANATAAARELRAQQKLADGIMNDTLTGLGKTLDVGPEAFARVANEDPQARRALAIQLQGKGYIPEDFDLQEVANMVLIPGKNGGFAVGIRGEGGQVSGYDPDGDGRPVMISGELMASITKSTKGMVAADGATASQSLAQGLSQQAVMQAEAARAAALSPLQAEAASLGEVATRLDAQLDEMYKYGSEYLRGAHISRDGGSLAAVGVTDHESYVARLTQLEKESAQIEKERAKVGSQAAKVTEEYHKALAGAGTAIQATLGDISNAQEPGQAARNTAATANVFGFGTAVGAPGKSPTEALTAGRDGRRAIVEQISSALGYKVEKDDEGRVVEPNGLAARMEAVLYANGDLIAKMLRMDTDGQQYSAILSAAQQAAEMKKPEAFTHALQAMSNGLDSKLVVAVQTDPGISKQLGGDPKALGELAKQVAVFARDNPKEFERLGMGGTAMLFLDKQRKSMGSGY